jgi:phosphoribosylcarboxyaminoimidazole (NCAIR) mutase
VVIGSGVQRIIAAGGAATIAGGIAARIEQPVLIEYTVKIK